MNYHPSRHHAQQESRRHNEYVEQNHALQEGGIHRVDGEVGNDHEKESRIQLPRRRQAAASQNKAHHGGGGRAEPPGSNRPEPFDRMVAVFRRIQDVIHDVGGAGNNAEHQSRQHFLPAAVPAREALGEDEGGEDESILHPLLGPQGFHQRPQRGSAVESCVLNQRRNRRRIHFHSPTIAVTANLMIKSRSG